MDIHQYSPTLSNDFDSRKSDAGLSPYHQSTGSPVLLAEMRTTRTEVVTTTTTETTTHLFSLPYWTGKCSAGPHAPIPQRHSDDPSPFKPHSIPKPLPSVTLFDKALPPTPPDELEIGDTNHLTSPISEAPKSAAFPSSISQPSSILARSRNLSAGPQSTTALAHAALGIGLPHASTSFSREANTIAFMAPSSSPMVAPSSGVRRVKSSQRVQPRHVSENHETYVNEEQLVERRRRGLSFSATSFLNIVSPDIKGKGKEIEPAVEPHLSPKPLPRKSSFWSKKKVAQTSEPASSPNFSDSTTLTLPTLPPVHNFSPLEISDFNVSLSPTATTDIPRPQPISRSYSEHIVASPSPTPSPKISDPSISFPWPNQVQESTSNRALESRPSLDPYSQPRSRTQTNTPLLHRLSMGVFSSGESSPATSIRSYIHSHPLSSSSYPHTPKQGTHIPKPFGDGESPEMYLMRLKSAVSKVEVAGILASSSDPFHAQALRNYISQFQFLDIPIDVALRKLLMEVGLPRETQQIDRVMEAFASRYMQCNSNIFISEDHPYILAFSLIMLHTDAFNPSNKRKMSKADYIKNTKLPGIPVEVLECLFDNIVFAPFIYIEDPVDFNGQLGLAADPIHPMAITSPTSAVPITPNPASFKIGNKVDPYYLIINNLLAPLRVDVNSSIPLENPFTYEGSEGPWDEQELHYSFVQANTINVNVPHVPRTATIFSLNNANGIHLNSVDTQSSNSLNSKTETWSLKITKIGLLNRKDDLLEGAKKSSNRKWRTWSVILTGSQILLFRDPTWATTLSQPVDAPANKPDAPSPTNLFRPDESFSVNDAIAVYDRSYTKYKHTMRFVLPDGRQMLFQAHDVVDLNEWIAKINYASAFKSAGVRMRPPGLSGEDVLLTGVAAATSHLHDMQSRFGRRRPRSWDFNVAHDLMDMLSGQTAEKPPLKRTVTMSGRHNFDLEAPVAPEVEGAEQFKATFDQVKADLAASSWSSLEDPWLSQEEDGDDKVCLSPSISATSLHSSNFGLPSRSQVIQAKVRELDTKIHASQAGLDSDMRHVRNIAILTPFQKSTRSRLATAIQGMAKRIALVRINIEKLKCHRDVLRCDLASEGRTWNDSKQIALRAAKETLQSRRGQNVPTMTLSLLDENFHPSPEYSSPSANTPSSQRPDSSTRDSFHSVTDFEIEWTSSENVTFLTSKTDFPRKSQATISSISSASPKRSGDIPRRPMSPSRSQRPCSHPETSSSFDDNDDVNHYDDEQAEEWNQTRCAQRVSLIHVPSNIGLSTRLRNTVDRS